MDPTIHTLKSSRKYKKRKKSSVSTHKRKYHTKFHHLRDVGVWSVETDLRVYDGVKSDCFVEYGTGREWGGNVMGPFDFGFEGMFLGYKGCFTVERYFDPMTGVRFGCKIRDGLYDDVMRVGYFLYQKGILSLYGLHMRKWRKTHTRMVSDIGLDAIAVDFNLLKDIPKSFRDIDIKRLSMRYNIIQEFPLVNIIENLSYLDLSGNRLENIPQEIKSLKKLVELRLSDCFTTNNSEILSNAAFPDSLMLIQLDNNSLCEFPSQLLDLPFLMSLHMRGNKISIIPSKVSSLQRLVLLNLENNNITDYPDSIFMLTSLTELNLRGNSLRDDIPLYKLQDKVLIWEKPSQKEYLRGKDSPYKIKKRKSLRGSLKISKKKLSTTRKQISFESISEDTLIRSRSSSINGSLFSLTELLKEQSEEQSSPPSPVPNNLHSLFTRSSTEIRPIPERKLKKRTSFKRSLSKGFPKRSKSSLGSPMKNITSDMMNELIPTNFLVYVSGEDTVKKFEYNPSMTLYEVLEKFFIKRRSYNAENCRTVNGKGEEINIFQTLKEIPRAIFLVRENEELDTEYVQVTEKGRIIPKSEHIEILCLYPPQYKEISKGRAHECTIDKKKSLKLIHKLISSSKNVSDAPNDIIYGLRNHFTEEEVQFEEYDGHLQIKSATKQGIIEILTNHLGRFTEFESDFLHAFEIIMTPTELFQLLIERYDTLSKSDLDFSVAIKSKISVLDFFKTWFQHKPEYFTGELKDKIISWGSNTSYSDLPDRDVHRFKLLLTGIESGAREKYTERVSSALQEERIEPTPLVPSDLSYVTHVFEIHYIEVARQMTLIEEKLFKMIDVREFLTGNHRPSTNRLVEHFNNVAEWVSTSIVLTETVHSRTYLIDHFINIANHLFQLNNFNGILG
eukprot:TRINITY_DN2517_c0_g1_i1.p1 TRINITY_DN2517_c0_g1~~TRINITY_DN2517_c0_g1_i1.p1  ORF type:complete len:900 (-),score=162.15 TRINITY_DN2517_c0_g1_i1:102-2801(-)